MCHYRIPHLGLCARSGGGQHSDAKASAGEHGAAGAGTGPGPRRHEYCVGAPACGRLLAGEDRPTRTAAWYPKARPTFSHTPALVRRYLWTETVIPLSPAGNDLQQIPSALADHLADLLAQHDIGLARGPVRSQLDTVFDATRRPYTAVHAARSCLPFRQLDEAWS